MKNSTVKRVEKSILFSGIRKQRPKADNFFGDAPHCANKTDVSSDMETNVRSLGRVKNNIIRLPVDKYIGFYLQYIHIFYTHIIIYLINNIIEWDCRGLRANFNDFRLLCDNYNPIVCCLQETMLTMGDFVIRGHNCIHLMSRDIGGTSCVGVSLLARDGTPYSECMLNTTLQEKQSPYLRLNLLLFVHIEGCKADISRGGRIIYQRPGPNAIKSCRSSRAYGPDSLSIFHLKSL